MVIVQDISNGASQRKQVLDFLFLPQPELPLFHVCGVGIVPGDQSVARAELFAVLTAATHAGTLSPVPIIDFYTDASYVCRIIEIIRLGFSDRFAQVCQR